MKIYFFHIEEKLYICNLKQENTMIESFVDTKVDVDVLKTMDDLTTEEKASWLASIEHDLQNPNRGKVRHPIEELWQKLDDAVTGHHERASR